MQKPLVLSYFNGTKLQNVLTFCLFLTVCTLLWNTTTFSKRGNLSTKKTKHVLKVKENQNSKIRRVIIVAGWNTGSTFAAYILNVGLQSYLHYEPLYGLGMVMARKGSHFEKPALNIIQTHSKCKFDRNEKDFMVRLNPQYSNICQERELDCKSPENKRDVCKELKNQLFKTCRLRLELAHTLLDPSNPENTPYDTYVIYLTRDPRGIMQSRRNDRFCRHKYQCSDQNVVNQDLLSDYEAAKKLQREFPNNFRVLRYEDLLIDLKSTCQQIFNFLGVEMTAKTTAIIDNETKKQAERFAGRSWIGQWRYSIRHRLFANTESKMKDSMAAWGYLKCGNITNPRNCKDTFDRDWSLH